MTLTLKAHKVFSSRDLSLLVSAGINQNILDGPTVQKN